MSTHVFIGTTCGPVGVQRITDEDSGVQSVICLNGTVEALPVSAAYHDFVRRGTGVIARDFGHDAFRVDVAERVDQGVSWQLPVYVAHALHARGELGNGRPEAGDRVIWATGEVGAAGEIRPVERTAEKLKQSLGRIRQWRESGIEVQLLLPDSNLADSVDHLSDLAGVAGVHTLKEALGQFETGAGGRSWRGWPWRRARPALVAAFVVMAVALAVWLGSLFFGEAPEIIELDDFGGRVEVPARAAGPESMPTSQSVETGPSSPRLRVGRTVADGGCDVWESKELVVDSSLSVGVAGDKLCALAIEMTGRPAPLVVDLAGGKLIPLGPERHGERRIRINSDSLPPRTLAIIWPDEAPLRTESMLTRFLARARAEGGLNRHQLETWAHSQKTVLESAWLEIH